MERTGIIYRAYNVVTEKSYVGQTVNTLNQRRSNHFSQARLKKSDNHFMRALKKYSRNSWVWSVLETTSQELLNEREQYWISYYDTYNNGYNSNLGGDSPIKISKIHSIYHPNYGTFTGNYFEVADKLKAPKNILPTLLSKRIKQYKGWVLDIYKDDYNSFIKERKVKKYSLYHKDYGVVLASSKEMIEKYNISLYTINQLDKGLKIELKGWRLAINKDIVIEPKKKALKQKEIILIDYDGNKIEGIIDDICRDYNINIEVIRHLQNGRQKGILINNVRYCIFYKL